MTPASSTADRLAQCCAQYAALGLPAGPRGEFVEIRTDSTTAVLLLPDTIGPALAAATTGPVLSPVPPSRWWRFLTRPDPDGVARLLDHAADDLNATLCHNGAVLLLPTTPEPRHNEGCAWFRPAAPEHPVPLLSDLVGTALAITDSRCRPGPDRLTLSGPHPDQARSARPENRSDTGA